MKKMVQSTLLLSFLLMVFAATALAQDQPTTNGPVWRIAYTKVKPGKNADYMKWIREYRLRVLAEQKSAGLILDYKFFSKPTSDNTPTDWDTAAAVLYRTYADALDDNADGTKKFRDIVIKVFGSLENQTKMQTELRNASSDFVSSELVREFVFNPIKPAASGN